MSAPLLEARDLTKQFPFQSHPLAFRSRSIEAVAKVNLSLKEGESVGLVGESGCGKSTLARLLAGLLQPTSGFCLYRGRPIDSLRHREQMAFRRSVQLIFQDPMASLNPLMRIGQTVAEPILIHRLARGKEADEELRTLFQEVGLDPTWANRYPQSLSGGQRQRVGIARALSLHPKLLICDEAVSSLDLSVQAQILRLLIDLQVKRRLALLFISHNLATVSAISDRILVMREGRIVEEGPNPRLFQAPQNPYTRTLVNLALQRL